MFKDLYKNANDKIPTEDAYLRVMESVKTKSRKTKYSYAKIVALAACFLLTVSMISVYENFAPKEEVPFEVITPENLPTATSAPANKIPETTAVPIAEPIVVTETLPLDIGSEPVLAQEVIETSEPAFEGEPIATEEPQSTFVKNQGIPENIGISVARFTLGDTVTKDTYYEYLGNNVEENLVLPEGFINETPDEHMLCLEECDDFDDRWTFYFTNDENSIFITTTKNTQNVYNLLSNENYEKSDIFGTPALLFEEDMQKIACIEVGGISYTLSSYGVSDEDFQNIIISLLK